MDWNFDLYRNLNCNLQNILVYAVLMFLFHCEIVKQFIMYTNSRKSEKGSERAR